MVLLLSEIHRVENAGLHTAKALKNTQAPRPGALGTGATPPRPPGPGNTPALLISEFKVHSKDFHVAKALEM